jgi:hypothetical protein
MTSTGSQRARVALREVIAADRRPWPLHIRGRENAAFSEAQRATCGFWFQRFGFPAIGAGYPKSQPLTRPLIGGNSGR